MALYRAKDPSGQDIILQIEGNLSDAVIEYIPYDIVEKAASGATIFSKIPEKEKPDLDDDEKWDPCMGYAAVHFTFWYPVEKE